MIIQNGSDGNSAIAVQLKYDPNQCAAMIVVFVGLCLLVAEALMVWLSVSFSACACSAVLVFSNVIGRTFQINALVII